MRPTNDDPDDVFAFSDVGVADDESAALASEPGAWRIFVVDDDADVHQSTKFSLDGVRLFGRPLELLHASSAAEARRVLASNQDIAVLLLDVVMETPDAGLSLIEHIRTTLGMSEVRIILRTGQPGYAPEHDTLLRYDINDYKTKSELTHHKLLASITTTIRAYQQLRLIEASRRGLERVVEATGELMQVEGLQKFASGVITQIAALLGTQPEGVVCAQGTGASGSRVLAAAGRFADQLDQPLNAIPDQNVVDMLQSALQQGRSLFSNQGTALFLGRSCDQNMAAYVQTHCPVELVDMQLLQVFCSNLSACLNNLMLMKRLHLVAYQDPLLKLPNRTRLIDVLSEKLRHAEPGLTLTLIDVDDFASVNDLMGHDYGDQLLISMAQRLLEVAGPEAVLARVSGNGFGLLGPSDMAAPEQLLQAFEAALPVRGQPHRVSVSLGVCDAASLEDTEGAHWLTNANIALKQAKRVCRGGFVRFTNVMALQARYRAQMLSDLRDAFDQNQLFLAFQPQLDLATGHLIGLEALTRWRCHDGRQVPPDQFIPVAEQSGLIVSLGDWVLKTACLTMRQLLDQGMAPERMAINVSMVQFQSPGFIDRVELALAAAGLLPRHLELEITESVSLLGQGVIEPMLARLRSMGVSVALDDFGTGYSSLSYLERLPLDRIKIDKAFVRPGPASDGQRITELIVQLGLKLGLRVLAEGIEDARAWNTMGAMGVHEGQGYHISRPLELPALVGWLQSRPPVSKLRLES